MRLAILLCVCLLIGLTVSAQKVENVSSVVSGGKAIITYDLVGLRTGDLYNVSIYSSHDNFERKLTMVAGDAGTRIAEGKQKRIEWSVAEAGGFQGPFTFDVKIALAFQPLEFINPTGGGIRRGEKMLIEWRGGYLENEKEVSLYYYEKQVAVIGHVKDRWLIEWTVPRDLKTGDGYTIKLTSANESRVSNSFRVKPRTPLLLKLSPILVAAAAVWFFDKSDTKSDQTLPGAPEPE